MQPDEGQVMVHVRMVGSAAAERGLSPPSLSFEVGKGRQGLSRVIKEEIQEEVNT